MIVVVIVEGSVRKATRARGMEREREGRSYLLIRVVRLCIPWPELANSEDMFGSRGHETGLRADKVVNDIFCT